MYEEIKYFAFDRGGLTDAEAIRTLINIGLLWVEKNQDPKRLFP